MNKLLGYLLGAVSFMVLIFRGKALKAQLNLKTQQANQAEAINAKRRKRDKTRRDLQEKHKQEQRDALQSIDDGRRDQLDNDW